MGTVGGNRHYMAGGLGAEGAWSCPACGAENLGPIAQGCLLCGAGRPGRRASELATPPVPPPPPPVETPEPRDTRDPSLFADWWTHHPDATIEQAFTAGYIEGVRAARRAELAAQAPPPLVATEDKARRTIVAALALFRDQVLAGTPEEVTTGEWLSAEEADAVIAQLTELDREITHA